MLCLCVTLCTAGERAMLGGTYGPKLKIQKQDSPPKRQGSMYFDSFSLNYNKHVEEF